MSAAKPGTSAPRAQIVASNSIWMTLDAFVALPVSLALSILVARKIGPDVLGLYNFANWVLGAGIVVVTNGVTFGMQVFAAEKLGQQDVAGATSVLRLGLRWQLGLIAVLVPLGIALTLAFCPPQFQVALLIAVASIAPAILVSVPAAGIGAAQALAANAIPSMVATVVNLTVAVVAIESGWGLVGVTSALLASRLIDAGLRFVAWRRVWSGLSADATLTGPSGTGTVEVARLRRYALKSSLLLLIGTVVWDRSEFFVLTRFSSLREMAFYSLSFNIVQQVLILPRVFTQGIAANLLVERGRDPQVAVRLSGDAMRYVFLLAAPLTLGLAALDRAVMPLLYGPAYVDAIPVIAVVAGLAVIKGALLPVQALLYMTEQQSFLIGFSLFLGVVNVALDLWLIPTGGAIGAAWANGITQAIATVGLTGFAAWRLGLSPPLGDLGRILLACVPMVVIVRIVANSMHHWPAVLIGVPAGAAIYLVGLKALRILRTADQDRLSSLDRYLPMAVRSTYRRGLGWMVARAPSH